MRSIALLVIVLYGFYPSQAQESIPVAEAKMGQKQIQACIDSVQIPGWRCDFGLFALPVLSESQKVKKQYLDLKREILSLEDQVTAKNVRLQKKREAIDLLLKGDLERVDSSHFLLGLFSHEKKVKRGKVLYHEKRLFWGAIKWGKRKPKVDQSL